MDRWVMSSGLVIIESDGQGEDRSCLDGDDLPRACQACRALLRVSILLLNLTNEVFCSEISAPNCATGSIALICKVTPERPKTQYQKQTGMIKRPAVIRLTFHHQVAIMLCQRGEFLLSLFSFTSAFVPLSQHDAPHSSHGRTPQRRRTERRGKGSTGSTGGSPKHASHPAACDRHTSSADTWPRRRLVPPPRLSLRSRAPATTQHIPVPLFPICARPYPYLVSTIRT